MGRRASPPPNPHPIQFLKKTTKLFLNNSKFAVRGVRDEPDVLTTRSKLKLNIEIETGQKKQKPKTKFQHKTKRSKIVPETETNKHYTNSHIK